MQYGDDTDIAEGPRTPMARSRVSHYRARTVERTLPVCCKHRERVAEAGREERYRREKYLGYRDEVG